MGPTSCLIVAPYLCSIFTLVVDLFNKDDAEDGGLSFFYSTETQSKNLLFGHASLSFTRALVSRARENTSDPVSG